MPALFALATSVGLLAILDTWLFGVPALAAASLQVWISFISWGCYFQAGGKAKGAITATACMSFGALIGMIALILAGGPFAGLGTMAAPIAVGLGAAVIVLASKVPYLDVPPMGFFGFAAVAAVTILVRADDAPVSATGALVATIVSVIIGVIFGFISEMLANALTKKDGTPGGAA